MDNLAPLDLMENKEGVVERETGEHKESLECKDRGVFLESEVLTVSLV